jgi:hypothetical protein
VTSELVLGLAEKYTGASERDVKGLVGAFFYALTRVTTDVDGRVRACRVAPGEIVERLLDGARHGR